MDRRGLVGWRLWNRGRNWSGRNRLLLLDVEVFDVGGRYDENITVFLALDPYLPQGDVLARDNLFDFASQTEVVLETDVHGRAHPLSTVGRHVDGNSLMRIQSRAYVRQCLGGWVGLGMLWSRGRGPRKIGLVKMPLVGLRAKVVDTFVIDKESTTAST